MGRGVRTGQRYQATLHLPVHRIDSGKRSPVFAYRKDLDRWMQRHVGREIAAGMDERLAATKESRDKLSAIQQKLQLWRNSRGDRFEQIRQNRFRFMCTDLDAGFTFANIAENASDKRKRDRAEANARRALDTVLKLYRASESTEDERSFLQTKIADLRVALERLASRATKLLGGGGWIS